ncbi:chitosanase [Spirilliplanes yamanashiensis]|uniref:F5/8 type C domain-containing protein n=1 Tax=Spirilliplanes yamanashiensis TaxID=42233 RepID=A0A8J3YBV0_9ACTN|nr:chitosanase [Spirilliplanes yamanashiensis]MDP9816299.1 chitosanase [Spirilliplanes yamanashiensis]GIJ05826.1 hypothetical protein Sya03_51780 [Spirilliplanes yamanashiensis]
MKSRARLAALGAVSAVAVSVPLAVVLTADAAVTSLATGRPATASSIEDASLGPAAAVDGDTGTRWASAEGPGTQWLSIDLGAVTAVNRVVLRWEAAYARAYRIQVSADGATWTDAFATTTGNGRTDDLTGLTATGRHLRVLATRRGTQWGYSLYEVEVYGGGSAPASPTAPPATVAPTSVPPTTAPPTTAPPTTVPPTTAPTTPPTTAPPTGVDLDDPRKKDVAMQIVSTAENSSTNWRGQFGYIEDIRDGRGYTAGIIGFCSGTSDMLALVQEYTRRKPDNVLARYLPALRAVNGTASHAGLDPDYPRDWRTAAADPVFQQAQEDERDRQYFNPSLKQAKADGLRALGQFAYYDAAVMHGFGGMKSVRAQALKKAKPPSQGGDETAYLHAFLDARVAEMKKEAAHDNTTRVDTAQRVFLNNGNLDLNTPLVFKVYGQTFRIN